MTDDPRTYEKTALHAGMGDALALFKHMRTLLALVEMHPAYGTLCQEAEHLLTQDDELTTEDEDHPAYQLVVALDHFKAANREALGEEAEEALGTDENLASLSFLAACLSDAHRHLQSKVKS